MVGKHDMAGGGSVTLQCRYVLEKCSLGGQSFRECQSLVLVVTWPRLIMSDILEQVSTCLYSTLRRFAHHFYDIWVDGVGGGGARVHLLCLHHIAELSLKTSSHVTCAANNSFLEWWWKCLLEAQFCANGGLVCCCVVFSNLTSMFNVHNTSLHTLLWMEAL